MILESPSSLEEINVPRVLEDEVDFQGMRLKRVKVGPSLQANGSDAEETVDEKFSGITMLLVFLVPTLIWLDRLLES